jgi:hypothetical protein
MPVSTDELVAKLFKRGFNPDGVMYILRLMAAEHPEGSARGKELEVAADQFLE